jgi:tetratricopeptide (TPR) repeat protein
MMAMSFEHPAPPGPASPGAVDALYRTAYELHAIGRYVDAACLYRSMLALAPTDDRGWVGLGLCHEALGHREFAMNVYHASTVAVPGSVRCALARGRLLREYGCYAAADDAFDAAEQLARASGSTELATLVVHEKGES